MIGSNTKGKTTDQVKEIIHVDNPPHQYRGCMDGNATEVSRHFDNSFGSHAAKMFTNLQNWMKGHVNERISETR